MLLLLWTISITSVLEWAQGLIHQGWDGHWVCFNQEECIWSGQSKALEKTKTKFFLQDFLLNLNFALEAWDLRSLFHHAGMGDFTLKVQWMILMLFTQLVSKKTPQVVDFDVKNIFRRVGSRKMSWFSSQEASNPVFRGNLPGSRSVPTRRPVGVFLQWHSGLWIPWGLF